MKSITYNSPNKLIVGPCIPVRVNLSVGIEKIESVEREIKKIQAIMECNEPPDLMMDLSLVLTEKELWTSIRDEFYGPIGVVPHYAIFSDIIGLDVDTLLYRIKMLFKGGVNFITIHCTPSTELFLLAKETRYSPTTSRGGGIVIRDMVLNNRRKNIFSVLFEDICGLAKEFGAVINLGTTFRAASEAEGFDDVARQELVEQTKYCEAAEKSGVQVVLEGPGHISLGDLVNYYDQIKHMNAPPMPLGPIVTDNYSDLDHVAAAVGAANFMMISKGGIINAITSVEHRGGVPSLPHLLDGLKMAKLAAQIASLTYSEQAFKLENEIAKRRGKVQSCVLDSKNCGCSRCGHICPLVTGLHTENIFNERLASNVSVRF